MTARTPTMIAIDRRLKQWRKRELNDDGILWHGINRIRQGIADKQEAKAALIALVETRRVEMFTCGSGQFWRARPVDTIDALSQVPA